MRSTAFNDRGAVGGHSHAVFWLVFRSCLKIWYKELGEEEMADSIGS
jgi:hypothetical protein